MRGDFIQGGGGVALISSLCEGVEVNFCLMRGGGVDLVLGHIAHISQPPLQVIIAQSVTPIVSLGVRLGM